MKENGTSNLGVLLKKHLSFLNTQVKPMGSSYYASIRKFYEGKYPELYQAIIEYKEKNGYTSINRFFLRKRTVAQDAMAGTAKC